MSACPLPISTQWFNGKSAAAKVPLGSVNSNSVSHVLVWPPCRSSSLSHNVAVKFTGGGPGLPGTLKSMTALHDLLAKSALTTQVWLLPEGLIVIDVPEIPC